MKGLVEPVARGEEADNGDENDQGAENDDDAAEDASAFGLQREFFWREGLVGDDIGVGEMGKAHGLMAV